MPELKVELANAGERSLASKAITVPSIAFSAANRSIDPLMY